MSSSTKLICIIDHFHKFLFDFATVFIIIAVYILIKQIHFLFSCVIRRQKKQKENKRRGKESKENKRRGKKTKKRQGWKRDGKRTKGVKRTCA